MRANLKVCIACDHGGYDLKKIIAGWLKENNYILFFEHDADHECCTLQLNKNKFEAKEFFCLNEIN